MSIKMVAIDMDGTLLNEEKEIALETERALAAAVAGGIEVVIATGRSYVEFAPLMPQLGGVRYAATCAGSSVMELATKEILFSGSMPLEVAQEFYRLLADDPMIFEVFSDGFIYVPKDRMDNNAYYTQFSRNPIPPNSRTSVENMTEFLANLKTPVEKVHIYYYDNDTRNAGWDKIRHLPLNIATTEPVDLDVSPSNVHKGVAVKFLADRLGIEPHEVMVIGDSSNDLGMFHYAGTTVAMGNAVPELKEIATMVAASNDDNGVAKTLYSLLDGSLSL
ncbi:MAG: Cof-type HAD-IIB family hydrolase [Eubacteriales bacterium]